MEGPELAGAVLYLSQNVIYCQLQSLQNKRLDLQLLLLLVIREKDNELLQFPNGFTMEETAILLQNWEVGREVFVEDGFEQEVVLLVCEILKLLLKDIVSLLIYLVANQGDFSPAFVFVDSPLLQPA